MLIIVTSGELNLGSAICLLNVACMFTRGGLLTGAGSRRANVQRGQKIGSSRALSKKSRKRSAIFYSKIPPGGSGPSPPLQGTQTLWCLLRYLSHYQSYVYVYKFKYILMYSQFAFVFVWGKEVRTLPSAAYSFSYFCCVDVGMKL